MNLPCFYIAELGVGSEETVKRCTKSIVAIGTQFEAIEVYDTPFDAVRALNKTVKLMPEYYVTIYKSIENCKPVKISNESESKILVLSNMKFKKYQVMALGSLIYSL